MTKKTSVKRKAPGAAGVFELQLEALVEEASALDYGDHHYKISRPNEVCEDAITLYDGYSSDQQEIIQSTKAVLPTSNKETCLALAIDCSGSTYGSTDGLQASAIVADALTNHTGTPAAIFGVTGNGYDCTEIVSMKEFCPVDGDDKYRLMYILPMNATHLLQAMAYGANKLHQRPEPKKHLLLIIDDSAADCLPPTQRDVLPKLVKTISEAGITMHVIVFGGNLRAAHDATANMPNTHHCLQSSELPELVGGIVADILSDNTTGGC